MDKAQLDSLDQLSQERQNLQDKRRDIDHELQRNHWDTVKLLIDAGAVECLNVNWSRLRRIKRMMRR